MLLILEIVLTISACTRLHKAKKGWALGLIPVGAVVLIGMFAGMILGSMGANVTPQSVSPLIFLDFAAIIALIWMIIANKPPKVLPPPPPSIS